MEYPEQGNNEIFTKTVPSVPLWLSDHFSALPLVGWGAIKRKFEDRGYTNQSTLSYIRESRRPNFNNSPFRSVFQQLLVRGVTVNESKTSRTAIAHEEQGRAMSQPPFFFKDDQGNIYASLVIKGGGLITSSQKVSSPRYVDRNDQNLSVYGGENLRNALLDAETQDSLIQKIGLRTARSIGVFAINPADFNLEKQQAFIGKYKYGLDHDIHQDVGLLAIDIRAFRNPIRANVITSENKSEEVIREYVEMSMRLLKVTDNIEIGVANYLKFMRDILSLNLGKMANGGFLHANLIPHNITLAFEFVDFDTMIDLNNEKLDISLRVAHLTYELMKVCEIYLTLDKIIRDAYGLEQSEDTLMLFIRQYIEQIENSEIKKLINLQLVDATSSEDALIRFSSSLVKEVRIDRRSMFPRLLSKINTYKCMHVEEEENYCSVCGTKLKN
ncbi:MAG: hypothetical protein UX04_C0006G0036 [Microgenomates group bacterium GW2011_GWF2_45_18]|nr:MAG: hypothetical protein UW18_C0006G0036 [Microgenomates group bacterium GW2011_GWF1_44_10]KKU01501.1 MAG: hypothetical protein UX04_C0006G0036 [Microgenomates group bacterium GW2011_GWF2_45_18]OGJ40568.1 MAG: hypothetical protein A2378_01775 [Candidatus Pacebacteria bacterium RIFOXYB1_FULL_44_10]HAU99409.1 hypothetical protein [Candidatus Paceibacterota bacterium]HAX01584.1 hypothetical protein [Candidatus Paceibacterota bacterium]